LLVLCDELELCPDDVFLTAPPPLPSAKVLLPHLTLEVQTIRPGSKITVQGKLLGSGRSLLQRQIDSYFPPPEEAKLPAPDDPSKPTQQTMPGLHPDLKIMSWNARSADPFAQPSRLAQLSETLADHKVDILSIQEIRFPSIHVKGFVTVPFPFTRGSQGTTLLVHESLAWKKSTRLTRLLRHIPGIEAQIIDIFTPSTTFSVGAFYIHPSSPAESLRQALLIAMENGLSLYGDFDAKGQFNLQGDHSNGLGRMANKIVLEFPTSQIAFPDVPTFFRPGDVEDYETTLDGAISGDLQADIIVLRVLDELDSDHNPVLFQHLPPSPPLRLNLVASPPKFKVSLVNTPTFHKELSGLERLIKLPRRPQELDALANFTAESLRTATSRSTASPQSKASRLPFWDDELQSLRKAQIRARRRRDHQEYRKLARSFKDCLRAKKKTWQARLCAGINPSTAWEVTKKLTGLHKKAAPKPKSIARDMSAEQITHPESTESAQKHSSESIFCCSRFCRNFETSSPSNDQEEYVGKLYSSLGNFDG